MPGPVETFRGMVRAEQCDHFGHMNVQFYDAALSDGFFYMMNLIGLNREEVARRQLGLAAIEMTLNFRRELRPGDIYKVETGFLKLEPMAQHTAHRMTRLTDGKVALTARSTGFPMDLAARKRTAMPDDILAKMHDFLIDADEFAS
ncbi:MAG: thioesterase family protein [Minwuia sp.]|uniref:thioesterase family protein n=1 Tax=Minwuia sp. TaxID=2493630 RepID=UPI003A8C4330